MPAHTLSECRRFAGAVTAAHGRVPAPLANILAAADLLVRPSSAQDPLRGILRAARAGELDAKRLDKMLADAAQQQHADNYRQEVGRRAEGLLVEDFRRALADGCADEILTSLRPVFEEHAAQIACARTLIPAETELSQWLDSAQPEAVEVWQKLSGHLAEIDRIGSIAAAFGPRLGAFSLIQEYAGGDGYQVDDRAVFATGGSLVGDSQLFRGSGVHRASPWCRTTLELHTVDSAKDRYRQWCESEWDKTHYTRTVQHQRPDGSVGEFTLQNPFKANVNA